MLSSCVLIFPISCGCKMFAIVKPDVTLDVHNLLITSCYDEGTLYCSGMRRVMKKLVGFEGKKHRDLVW
jgi:hypothetical protein